MPPPEVYIRLASALGVTLSQLTGSVNGKTPEEYDAANEQAYKNLEWSDSGTLNSKFQKFVRQIYEMYLEVGYPTDPIFFAELCRSTWGSILALPLQLSVDEKINLVLSQHKIVLVSVARNRELERYSYQRLMEGGHTSDEGDHNR